MSHNGFFQKVSPELLSGGYVERAILQRQRDPALDCTIKIPDSVSCKEHDPSMVLQLAEKNRDAGISMAVYGACLHKHIRFIQEDQGFSVISTLRDAV